MPSYHLRKVFNPETLRRVAAESERLRIELGADIVCVRGLSGTLAASAMCSTYGTPFAVVRKDNEISHGRTVEVVDYDDNGDRQYHDWIIVDDLIASGHTVKMITAGVIAYDDTILGRCKGIVLYHALDDAEERDMGGYSVPVINIGKKVELPFAPITSIGELRFVPTLFGVALDPEGCSQ